ncbi:MAG: hypothetical protein Kow002_06100 [Anaerolineales bacterium]
MSESSRHILLVEDELAHAELVQRAFEKHQVNFKLAIASTVRQAKALMQENAFSLIITDWRLPDGKGTDLIGIQNGKSKIPVVIMTSYGDERIAVNAIKNGALDYVVKSDTTLTDMAHIVERALREWENITRRSLAEEQLKRRVAELEAVNRISTAMRTAESLQDMIPRLMTETIAMLAAQGGVFWLYNTFTKKLERAAVQGLHVDIPETIRPEQCIAYTAFASKQIHFISDFSKVDTGKHLNLPANMGGVCIPIMVAKEVIGIMLICISFPRKLTPEEVHLLTTLSEIAGNAIQRTRLHEQTGRNLKKMAALRAIDQAITSSVDLKLSLNILAEHAKAELEVDAVSISRLDPNTQYLKRFIQRGFHTPPQPKLHGGLEQDPAGKAVLEQRAIYIPNLAKQEATGTISAMVSSEKFHSYYVSPLLTKGSVNGVIEIFNRKPLQPDPEWVNFLEALSRQAAIAIENAQLFTSLERSNQELIHAYDATIEGWSRALDLRDKETEGHTRRVTNMTLKLAKHLGIKKSELVHIRRGSLLHDIGKMGIPDSILFKNKPLTVEEWKIMRQHPIFAFEMLSPIPYLQPALDIPYRHHERWDGKGYPDGLKGEQIPLAARIFSVVDNWDALNSDRPYRKAWSRQKIINYLREESGKKFDPHVVEVFLSVINTDEFNETLDEEEV